MNSLQGRSTTFDTLNTDIYPWVRAGAAVTLIAACLIVLSTRTLEAPITADVTRRSVSDRAILMREVSAMAPRVNEPYPTSEALATFPSLLLQVLPGLPDDLEYRFMGRDLIIWNARTNLIVDYLPDVLSASIWTTTSER